jgi:hypothetical protein
VWGSPTRKTGTGGVALPKANDAHESPSKKKEIDQHRNRPIARERLCR